LVAEKISVPVVTTNDSQPRLARLEIVGGWNPPHFVDARESFQVNGWDSHGKRLSTPGAIITLSEPELADATIGTVAIQSIDWGASVTLTAATLRYRKAGRLVVTARLDSVSASVVVDIEPTPPLSGALVADSFAVVEFKDVCAWDCPYIVYVPALRIRETTGQGPATLLAIRVNIDGASTSLCRGEYALAAGETRDISGFDPYLWSNDLLLVSLDGTRVKGDTATAQLLFRDGAGNYGRAEVRGPILRLETNPAVPEPPAASWTC
jgi:hypothetical protein